MEQQHCFHCGNTGDTIVYFDDKEFCCNGCKTVYEILNQNELSKYYDLETSPGKIPEVVHGKYDYLDNESIANKLLEFNNETVAIINLYIPHIHCSSCIWVLENLHRLNENIVATQVNFPKKTVRITYNFELISLKKVVLLLSGIGYEPYISLEDTQEKKKKIDHSLLYKLVTAGFAFGNVMLLSFPEYFELDEYWLNQYKPFFHQIMLFFSIPVVLYSAKDYFVSAYKGLKHKILNIDVPIALGILVLFTRSVYDIVTGTGQGFLDSLCGLVFFLLLGKFFQQKTYNFLSFERDYKSYFPIAVTKLIENREENIAIYEVKKGDRLLIRNEELIPVDGILIKGKAKIDYSFVTGEAKPVDKTSGDKIFAGGKQMSGAIEIEAIKSISQSYLTQLWSNDVFKVNKEDRLENLTNAISKYFTVIILAITFLTALYWYFVDQSLIINTVSAVLIVACPCALALSAPFTLGNVLRILGRKKIYLKNAVTLEVLSKVSTVVFDKTGTLTHSEQNKIQYKGTPLNAKQKELVKSTLRSSNHPLSRILYGDLNDITVLTPDYFEEKVGKGLISTINGNSIQIGSASFVGSKEVINNETSVFIKVNDKILGKYLFTNRYREGVSDVFEHLAQTKKLVVLSGDNEGEKAYLLQSLPKGTTLEFQKKPEQKLEYIKALQEEGECVMMVGDGLNDAGALAQSNVGIAIAENVNVFSPACDGIIDAKMFASIPRVLQMSKLAKRIIIASFVVSFLYNIIGLSFAVSGNLSPVIAAILMPLSSISVVAFVTLFSNVAAVKSNLK